MEIVPYPDHPTSDNYGIQNQTTALRWVRDNISAFGGDPRVPYQ
ncbi:MAG: hypothetical protein DRR04_01955 [Gammaproteobacteria bacterium]|nr:MAG: hypothetical protein DRQ97_01175 [Gammaproteobacteria bacterium]RLA61831.1 MAG: hypothetical protein DRR04_01955 [Gammaproteobacteria bacterium]